MILPSLLVYLIPGMARMSPSLRTLRVSLRALFIVLLRERPKLSSTARIERAHSYCARSASKEGTWPLPPHPSEAARCASTFLAQWSLQARSLLPFKGWPGLVPNCARRTTTASSWGFREHGGPTRPSLPPFPAMGLLPARFTGRMPDSTCDTKVRRG